jgi:hypothetical protein
MSDLAGPTNPPRCCSLLPVPVASTGNSLDSARPSRANGKHNLESSIFRSYVVFFSTVALKSGPASPLLSSNKWQQKSITSIAETHSRTFGPNFSDLIQTFERTTRKPTGDEDELRRIRVSAITLNSLWAEVITGSNRDVSRYCVGGWLADLFCLLFPSKSLFAVRTDPFPYWMGFSPQT